MIKIETYFFQLLISNISYNCIGATQSQSSLNNNIPFQFFHSRKQWSPFAPNSIQCPYHDILYY